jgi:uncharacterized membrane protein YsdA (DUF1294 family)
MRRMSFITLNLVLGYLAGVNVATLILYGYDKAVAGGGQRRVPESWLHGLALLGGTPGAFLAQRLFRHKTVKPAFQRTFWMIVVLQVALLGAWFWWLRR